jgi:hypothetical protein
VQLLERREQKLWPLKLERMSGDENERGLDKSFTSSTALRRNSMLSSACTPGLSVPAQSKEFDRTVGQVIVANAAESLPGHNPALSEPYDGLKGNREQVVAEKVLQLRARQARTPDPIGSGRTHYQHSMAEDV